MNKKDYINFEQITNVLKLYSILDPFKYGSVAYKSNMNLKGKKRGRKKPNVFSGTAVLGQRLLH